MTENLKKFLGYASKNEDITKKMKALTGETDKDTVIRRTIEIAKEAGFSLSAEDFEENAGGELSEDELASVAGGGACYCVVGGGGESSTNDYYKNETCACVGFGVGNYYHDSDSVYSRCECCFAGSGEDMRWDR